MFLESVTDFSNPFKTVMVVFHREDGSSRVLSNTGSFRSATSYASFKEGQATSFNASFRSCNSFKSTDGFSRYKIIIIIIVHSSLRNDWLECDGEG